MREKTFIPRRQYWTLVYLKIVEIVRLIKLRILLFNLHYLNFNNRFNTSTVMEIFSVEAIILLET